MPSKNVKFIQTTICDDIRAEADGRFSLMGVFTGELHFYSDEPTDVHPFANLAFYIECEIFSSVTLQFKFVAPDGKTILAESQGNIPFPDEEDGITVNLSPVPLMRRRFDLPQSGAYSLMGRELEGEWSCLRQLHVFIERPEFEEDEDDSDDGEQAQS